ncbi:MAG: hypothetical protein U0Q16_37965 [Bryobacteraceae bacterium]
MGNANADESIGLEYLAGAVSPNVVKHPDGSHNPPDFLVDGRIAVECRRLNQIVETGRGIEGIEMCASSIQRKIAEELSDWPRRDTSWFVSVAFSRPSSGNLWDLIRDAFRRELESFAQDPRDGVVLQLHPNCEVTLLRASKAHEQFFVMGSYVDHDSGGWVMNELEKSLAVIVPEKLSKVERVRARYPEWWLLLVDRVSHAWIDPDEAALLARRLPALANWDRVIVVDPFPQAPRRAVQLWPIPGLSDNNNI